MNEELRDDWAVIISVVILLLIALLGTYWFLPAPYNEKMYLGIMGTICLWSLAGLIWIACKHSAYLRNGLKTVAKAELLWSIIGGVGILLALIAIVLLLLRIIGAV